jgi:hypothetical protein|eukprot:scaffold1691_cov197-Chaetoceros_neogracile.AAC.3
MSQAENNVTSADSEGKDKPLLMYQYLHRLGDRQKEAMEKFYKAALEPCASGTSGGLRTAGCEDSLGDMSYFGCSFLSPNDDIAQQYSMEDPFNPDIVGPKCCEYCNARTTLECDPDKCDRPKLYFVKKRPPFEVSDQEWSPDGYASRDLELVRSVKNVNLRHGKNTLRNAQENTGSSLEGSFSRFFHSET